VIPDVRAPGGMHIEVAPNQEATALVYTAGKRDLAGVTVILGHGAGADQSSYFMTRFATGLAARGIKVVTFNFLYTEQGRRVPDANKALETCFRAVIEAVRHKKIGRGTLVIGGKSMGGRMPPRLLPRVLPTSKGSSSLGEFSKPIDIVGAVGPIGLAEPGLLANIKGQRHAESRRQGNRTNGNSRSKRRLAHVDHSAGG
jgi:hypothetical protein